MQTSGERHIAGGLAERGILRTGIVVSIVIVTLLVLVAVLMVRYQRRPDVSSTPSVEAPVVRETPPPEVSREAPAVPPRTSESIVTKPAKPSLSSEATRSRSETAPPRASIVEAPKAGRTEVPVVPPPAPTLPERRVEPMRVIEGLPPAVSLPGAGAAPELPDPGPPPRVFDKEWTALAQLLDRYEQAYDRLDANGAAAVWPSVDARALSRAFARLQVQDLDFGNCTFSVSENDGAARCAGVLRYARRIGDTTPKSEQHVWTIEFARIGETWQIVRIQAQ